VESNADALNDGVIFDGKLGDHARDTRSDYTEPSDKTFLFSSV
jgi:hypothetical protein